MDYTEHTRGLPDLSILIVSFNTRELTLACLSSIYDEKLETSIETLVWDNASTDGTVEAIRSEFPGVTLVASDDNLGFGCANNELARVATAGHLLLLNPDTLVLPGSIDSMMRFVMENPDASLVGGRTLNPDGSLNLGSCWRRPNLWSLTCVALGLSRLFPQSSLLNPEAMPGWRRDYVRHVDIVSGCLLLIDSDLWAKLSGFDPIFFMYGEDADLCTRAGYLGERAVLTPDVEIVHHGGASEPVRAGRMTRLLTGKAQYIARHWGVRRAKIGLRLIDAWPLLRLIIFVCLYPFNSRCKSGAATWRQVWAARLEWRRAFWGSLAKGQGQYGAGPGAG